MKNRVNILIKYLVNIIAINILWMIIQVIMINIHQCKIEMVLICKIIYAKK